MLPRFFLCIALPLIAIVFVETAVAENAQTYDLTIPTFEPKPPVWVEDLPAVDVAVDENKSNAKRLMGFADRLKSAGQYDKAAEGYAAALRLDPGLAHAAYQAACNFELAGEHQKAVAQFEQAIELGYDAFPRLPNS